jgi:hypothetical protein
MLLDLHQLLLLPWFFADLTLSIHITNSHEEPSRWIHKKRFQVDATILD